MRADKLITYTYRGQVERGADYHWCDGYSETTPAVQIEQLTEEIAGLTRGNGGQR